MSNTENANAEMIELYDWVDRKLQEMSDAEFEEYEMEVECYDWVDTRLQEMSDAEFRDLCSDDLHHFTYPEIYEYHELRNLERRFVCSFH